MFQRSHSLLNPRSKPTPTIIINLLQLYCAPAVGKSSGDSGAVPLALRSLFAYSTALGAG